MCALGGCTQTVPLDAVEVLNYGQCVGLDAGVTLVEFSDLAALRGSEWPAADGARQPDNHGMTLAAISRGPQPTPGYGFALTAATRSGATAEIRVNWFQPPADAMLAHVVTHPCLVLAMPGTGLRRIEVVDQTGTTVGAVALP